MCCGCAATDWSFYRELIAFVCFASGLGAQLGNGKRRDIRVVSAFDINHASAYPAAIAITSEATRK